MRKRGASLSVGAARCAVAVLAAACAGLSLVGCAPEGAESSEQPESTTSAPSTPAPAPTEQQWQRFTDPRMPYSFEIPQGYTVREERSVYTDMGLSQFSVLDAQGEWQLGFANGAQGLGGYCSPGLEVFDTEEIDIQPMTAPGYVPPADAATLRLSELRFAYRVSQLSDRVLASMAVVDNIVDRSCMYYNLIHVHDDTYGFHVMYFTDHLQVDSALPLPPGVSQREFKTMDEARAFMNTEEYKTLRRILTSLQF